MQNFLLFISEQWLLVGLLLATIYAFVWYESRKAGLPLTTQQLVLAMNSQGAIVLDIREPKEFSIGHIPGSINFRISEFKTRAKEIDKMLAKKVILVDKMGQGTGSFSKLLLVKGITAMRLKGGIMQWQNENLPLVKN